MALAVIFILGIANFALHRAVLESRHPLLGQFSRDGSPMAARLIMALEFTLLLAAMLLVQSGRAAWGWAYGFYSLGNAVSAWLILTRRI